MADFTITVPANQVDRVSTAFAKTYGYQTDIPNPAHATDPSAPATIPNPVTLPQFVENTLKRYVLDAVRNYEAEEARRLALLAVAPDIT